MQLENTGFIRISEILAPKGPIPVCKSTWWSGVKSGRFPRPVKLGPRTTAWRVEDILALIEAYRPIEGGKWSVPNEKPPQQGKERKRDRHAAGHPII